MHNRIELGGLSVDVERKAIKNMHLSVHPPAGRVTISAPERMRLEKIRIYVISKLDWIRNQQRKLLAQDRETPREYLERESHYLWGKRYLLTIEEADARQGVRLDHDRIILQLRPGRSAAKREKLLDAWYRERLKEALPEMLEKWLPRIGVELDAFHVQRMKTKWGSCSPQRKAIRLNTELAKKPKPCLEYLVVHELVHLIEATHNQRFIALMDHHLPNWRDRRNVLNDLPVRHESWRY